MFRKVIAKAGAAARKSAHLACPECGARPETLPSNSKSVITCARCGTKASWSEWSATARQSGSVSDPDRPPANTRIVRQADDMGGVEWNIPASGKSGGFMFFAIFWCAITAVVSGGFLFGEVKSDGDFPVQLILIPFFGIFWAIGLGMLYVACRNKYAKHRLRANRETVTLSRMLFGRAKHKSLPADGISSIAQAEFYQSNYQPVYGIEIKGRQGKLRFGTMLGDEDKAWLVADLRRVVFGAPVTAAARQVVADAAVRTRQAYFSHPVPGSRSHLWPLAILLTLIGVAFVCIGIFVIDWETGKTAEKAPSAIKVFDFVFSLMTGGFRVIWTLMSGLMAVGGIGLGTWLVRTRGQETRVEGSDSEIAIRTTRHGRVLKERVFPRAQVSDIRTSVSGSSNNRTMKRVELIVGDKAEKIAGWIDGEQADALVEEVRRAL